ncbi:hypothetical protein OM33_14185 [Pseudoalteromonas piratica]|uniref:Lipoprotein n=2 Tax=Pseudoalteromonas piratica TaxID=1348114 RepID=A0A0A7EJB6_9GAMM|nr:hypothetical protein OM33_14185 [Pseudoalteromonas piratica]
MKTLNVKILLIFVFGLFLAGCSNTPFYHKNMMRGQVVEQSAGRTLICIGAKHGAKVGQKYSVIRFHEEIAPSEGDDPYTIEKVGTVQITKIVNDHFATVKLLSGDIEAKDMVELEE